MGLRDFLGPEYAPVKRRKSSVKHPNVIKYSGKSIVGVTLQMRNGHFATCTAERGHADIDVVFEDGVESFGKTRRNFLIGNIAHPSVYNGIIGTEVKMNCGMMAKCIADRGCEDIDIEFSDGTIVRGTTRQNFQNGGVANPNVKAIDYPVYASKKRLGQRRQMLCGYYCTVVEEFNSKDITVEFDDGTRVEHRGHVHFDRGTIRHPKLGRLWGSGDSIAQRVLYYYIRMVYPDALYCLKLESLKRYSNVGFEIDIYIPSIRVGVEFDGCYPLHYSFNSTNTRKNEAIEASHEIDRLFVVRDNNKNIVVFRTPKITNIALTYTKPQDRFIDVYEAAKIILSELGNDVSDLVWEDDLVQRLRAVKR